MFGEHYEKKDDNLVEIKRLITQQGEAFDAFKQSHDDEIAELKKKGAVDPVLEEKLTKIGEDLDKAIEAKAKIEAGLEAEKKEREELEKRLNRPGAKAADDDDREQKLSQLNRVLSANCNERKRGHFEEFDAETYDVYRKAQQKYMREGLDALDADERKTLQVGVDGDGGYFVTPDTTGRMVKRQYETSPMRQIAAQQTISSDALEGMEDLDEAGAGYAGERSQSGNEKTPEVGKYRIPVFWIDTEPKATQQLLDDSEVNIENWLGDKVTDKFTRFENGEFVTGAANKIKGFAGGYETAADDGSGVDWGKIGHILTGADGAFPASNPADKIHDLVGLLKQAYLNNARFVTRRAVITLIRKFKASDGHYLWQPSLIAGEPERLAGYPVTRAEDMPALAADSLSMAFGDFREGYQIVDRAGMTTLRDPYTAKPYVKFYTRKRVGGGVLNFEAIKFLKFGQ